MRERINLEATHRSLLEEIATHHTAQLKLCERLEVLADGLPNNFDIQECLTLSWRVCPAVKSAHRFEEEKLFPILLSGAKDDTDIASSIKRLRFEHWEDESSAEDLSLQLREMVKEPQSANIEKISYMLRGFFEGVRRHIAFETEHLLPLIKKYDSFNAQTTS